MERAQDIERRGPRPGAGFTLLEVLLAIAILAVAILSLTGLRTSSLMNAAEARNLRVAASIAKQLHAEIHAGQHLAHDIKNQRTPHDRFEHYAWELILGQAGIEQRLAEFAETQATTENATRSDQRLADRRDWLNRRSESRRAAESEDGTLDEELELEPDESPDEDTYEDFAVFVYYPSPNAPDGEGYYILQGRTTTLALSGLTIEQAEDKAQGLGGSATSGGEEGR